MNGSKKDNKVLYEFDGFRADPVRRRLSRGGEVVSLTPKAFSILLVLLENRGQVVPKEDLIQQIWPDTFVTEANLTQNISSLRKALGERANDPRYVVTVPGQGYTFVADVYEMPRDGTGEMPAFLFTPAPEPPAAATPTPAAPFPVPFPARPEAPAPETVTAPLPPISPLSPVSPPPPSPPAAEPEEPTVILAARPAVSPEPPPEEPAALPLGPAPSLLEDTGSFRPSALPVSLPLRRRTQPAVLLALLVLGLVAVPFLYLYQLGRGTAAAEAEAEGASGASNAPRVPRAAVAVLPFTNLSGNPKADWLSQALSEMLTTELQAGGGNATLIKGEYVDQTQAVLVNPDQSRTRADGLRKLHDLLGADLIVHGRYLLAADHRIRWDLWVIEVATGKIREESRSTQIGTEAALLDLVSKAGAGLRSDLGWAQPSPAQAREAEALRPANPEANSLYSEGLEKLRAADPNAARERLEKAAAADPKSPVIFSDLARAWGELGYDAKALNAAQKALDLATPLSKSDRLAIQARYHEAKHEWDRASEIYRTLWTFYPEDLEYGLLLVNTFTQGARFAEAQQAVEDLRKLPAPKRDDPRIDLAEAGIARRAWNPDKTFQIAKAAEIKGWDRDQKQIAAQALALEGQASQIRGDLDDAIRSYRQASGFFREAGNLLQVATMDTWTGWLLEDQGKLGEAQKQFAEALAIADKVGSRHLAAVAMTSSGLVDLESGELDKARALLEKAEPMYRETGDAWLASRTSYFIGQVLWREGDIEGARQRFEAVLNSGRISGNRIEQAVALQGMGQVLARQGQLADSRRSLEQALEIAKRLNDPYRMTDMETVTAEVVARMGELDLAEKQFNIALEDRKKRGGRVGMAEILGRLSQLAYRQGDLERARKLAKEEWDVARDAGAELLAVEAQGNLGRIALAEGDLKTARAAFEAAQGTAKRLHASLAEAGFRLDLAELELLSGPGHTAAAIDLARAVAKWFEIRQIPGEQARALALLAEGLLRQGNVKDARDPAERARVLADRSEDGELQIAVITRVARIDAASGETQGAEVRLRRAVEQAGKKLVPAALEASLALGSIQVTLAAERTAGLQLLEAVRREATQRGLRLTAQRADDVLRTVKTASRIG